ncbi:MAG TPA: DUF445 domain-containing protein [Clostridia bacterium]|nr:DUF445 domain-containing protein [Clostridia bacterium]
MKKNNRYIASVILIVVTIGFLLLLPFSGSFWGGLFTALFSASMIGGFADWFGVTALTRKPLGIPFKTEIVQHSREKLFNSLVFMVEDELLTKDAILEKFENFSFSASIIRYLDDSAGKEEVKKLANKIAGDMLSGIDMEETGEYLRKLLKDNTESIKLAPLVSEAVEWLSANLTDERLIKRTVEEFKEFMLFPQFGKLVNGFVSDIYAGISRNAEKETAGKKMFFRLAMALAEVSQVSPMKLSTRLLTEGLEYLNALKEPESEQRKGLEAWLTRTSDDLLHNGELQDKIENKGRGLFERKGSGAAIADYVYPLLREGGPADGSINFIDSLIDRLVEDFKNDRQKQAEIDRYIKTALTKLIEDNHAVIGQLVREKLNSFTDEMLVDLVENKAGNDLQIIRINGSLVGGLAGVVLYLIGSLVGIIMGG